VRLWLVVLAACAHPHVPAAPRCTLGLATGGDLEFASPAARSGTIASVSIEGVPGLAPLVRGVIETHPGQPVAEAPLADDLRRLWAQGVLADAHVDARETPDGVAIAFVLAPQPRIRSVHGADTPELRRMHWLAGTPYDPMRVARVAREIEAAYLRDGYLDATVDVHRSRDLDLCVAAYRGPQVTIRSLTFPGAHALTPSLLLAALHGKGVNHPGGTYDPEALSDDTAVLLDAYYERGMIQAKVGDPQVARYNDKLDVALPITEGPIFHLGRVTGLAHGLHRGDLFVRSKVGAAVREMSAALDADITPVTKLDFEKHTVELTFEIEWREPWSALRLLSWH